MSLNIVVIFSPFFAEISKNFMLFSFAFLSSSAKLTSRAEEDMSQQE